MPTTPRTTPYEVITARILTLLEQGTVPWHRPWASATGMPRNLFSQRAYRGINVWLLTAMSDASPFWATFQQVTTAGGRVRKGERGVPVVFWKVYHRDDPETGEAEQRFVLRQYTVFNAAQLDGVAVPAITVLTHRFTPSSGVPTWWTPCPTGPRSSMDTSAPATRPPPIPCICRARRASRAQKRITPQSFMN